MIKLEFVSMNFIYRANCLLLCGLLESHPKSKWFTEYKFEDILDQISSHTETFILAKIFSLHYKFLALKFIKFLKILKFFPMPFLVYNLSGFQKLFQTS